MKVSHCRNCKAITYFFIIIFEAEAYAIEVKAKAEAEQMAKKADAWKEYQEAALVDMMLKVGSSFYKIYLIVHLISRCCLPSLPR